MDMDYEEVITRLVDGWKAVKKIHEHTIVTYLGTSQFCRTCALYASALLRGEDTSRVRYLMCEDMQRWTLQVKLAEEAVLYWRPESDS